MASLDNVSTDDLRQVLAEVEGKKPTQRVMAAINYLEEDEAKLEDVAERYGYTAGWLSRWLDRLERLETEPFEAVEPLRSPPFGVAVEFCCVFLGNVIELFVRDCSHHTLRRSSFFDLFQYLTEMIR